MWLIAKIDNVTRSMTSQAKHVEATKTEISSSSAFVALYLASSLLFVCLARESTNLLPKCPL